MIQLNLASGQRPFKKPWVNIDIKDQGYPIDIITDIKELSMFEDNSVDIIVLHHVVEHIAIHELESYVSEWYRVLKKGGKMAVFVPNLKEINRAWQENRISTFIHNVNTYGAYQDSIHDLHKWGYDQTELVNRLSCRNEQTGEIKFNWDRIQSPEYNSPLYQGAEIARDWWILESEFVK